jgi:hypothetical protein
MTMSFPRSQRQAEVYHWYALYGELSENLPPGKLHCESIADRSRLYDWDRF